jgi:hypothetical protein
MRLRDPHRLVIQYLLGPYCTDTQCVANRCGNTKTWTGRKCRNKVAERGDTCWRHTLLVRLFRKGPPERKPHQVKNRATSTSGSGRRKKDDPDYRSAAKVGRRVNGYFWRQRIAKRALHTVDHNTWALFSDSDAATSCRTLATIAQRMEDAKAEVQKQMASLATSAMRNNSVIARKVADAIAKKIVKTVGYKVITIIRSIRIAGVWVCADAGRDLGRCRCLQALLRVDAPRIVKQQLRDGFKELAAEHFEVV